MSFPTVKLAGWADTSVGDLVTFHRGVSYKRTDVQDEESDENIPILRATNIQNSLTLDDPVYVPENLVKTSQKIRKNDIVIAMSSGSKSIVGKTAQASSDLHAAHGAFCGVARPKTEEVAGYLGYLFKSKTYRDLVTNSSKGTSINNLKIAHVLEITFSLPPLAEQGRIVDKIEELFSAIEAGERAIERARAALSRYRKSILKAAVTGELTRDWREENPSSETAEELLERILKARFEAWEKAELDKLTSKSKPHPQTDNQREKFRARYKQPVAPDTEDLPDLPEGWLSIGLDEFGLIVGGQTASGILKVVGDEGEIPFFKVGSMNDEGNSHWMKNSKWWLSREDAGRLGQRVLPKGTIIFPKRGGAILTNKKRRLASNAAIDLNLMGIVVPDAYSDFAWVWCKQLDLRKIYDGSNVPQINHRNLAPLSIAIPPLDEQAEIVSRVEVALSKADAVEATLEAQAQSARALKQSVLKTAFEGRLVPQDPNDEPASELLKRIKAVW